MEFVPSRRDMEPDVPVEELVPLASVHGIRSRSQEAYHARINRNCLGSDGFKHFERIALLTDGPSVDVIVRLAGYGLFMEPVERWKSCVSEYGLPSEPGAIRTIKHHSHN